MPSSLCRALEIAPGRTFTVAAGFIAAFAFLPLPFGSAATVVFFVAAAIALAELSTGAAGFRIPRGTGFAVAACLAYFAVDALSLVIYADQPRSWASMVTSLQFAALPIVLAVFSQAAEADPLRGFIRAARAGAIISFMIAAAQVGLDGADRATGGMINPIPFGVTAALFAFVSLVGVADEGRRGRIVALVAFVAGLAASFLSETRGAWLCLPVFVVILLYYLRARLGARPALAASAGVVLLAVLAVGLATSSLRDRLDETIEMFLAFEPGGDNTVSTSLDQRLLLWTYGLEAFGERPLFGYGPESDVDRVQALAAEDGYQVLEFAHLHNEFLTEAVGNGVVGLATLFLVLAAPLVTVLRGPRDRQRPDRIAFAAFVTAGSAISGLTGIAFGHDILNTLYVSSLLVVCLSVTRTDGVR